jgi:chromosome segregation ATPase
MESERRSRDEAREQIATLERRAALNSSEMDELRALLETAEKARKAAENELHEAADRVSELTSLVSSLNALKRKMETDIQAMHVSFHDATFELALGKRSSNNLSLFSSLLFNLLTSAVEFKRDLKTNEK